jgi:Dolichyl-phosphate-mannose-protein mannosyltransferase
VPPGLFFDEAANLFDISSVLQGARPLYFPANNGREPMFFYWASLFATVWGLTPYAIRLASAVVGILTLAATFFCAREAARAWTDDRRWADWTAVASSFILSITYVHLHYSRIGLRTILLPLFLALSFGFLLRGLRGGSLGSWVLSGIFGGLSFYTYISSRIAPALLAVPPLALLPQRRFRWAFSRMLLVGALWVLVGVPLGIYFIQHPADVQGHTDDVSILNPINNRGDPIGAVARGIYLTARSVDFVGTGAAEQNLPFRPIFDPLQSLFFLTGLGTLTVGAIGSIRSKTVTGGNATSALTSRVNPPLRPVVAVLLVTWIIDQGVPSALAVSPPGFIRMTGMLPALAIVSGVGLSTAYRWLASSTKASFVAPAAIAAALAISSAWTIRDYFFVWAPSPAAYHLMMADKVAAANYLASAAATNRTFLAPLYAQDNTIKFLTRNVSIESFDIGEGLVVPTDRTRDVQYVFPVSDTSDSAFVAAELPVTPIVDTIADPTNNIPVLTRLELPAASLPPRPATVATFGDSIGLVRSTIDPSRVAPGGTIIVTLVWLALKPTGEDFTVFVHLRDPSNATAAQSDGQPAVGTLPTTRWKNGDLIWDRHRLTVPPTIKPGHYRIMVGMYRRADLQRLPAQTAVGRASSDEVQAGAVDVSAP